MAILQVVQGPNPGQVFPLEEEICILGRHPECDVVLEVGAVSRQHARVLRINDDFFLEDLNSRNGTFLNNARLEGRAQLSENDQVRICDVVLVFHQGPPVASPPAASPGAADQATIGAMVIDDDQPTASSTIMSKVSISAGATGLVLAVNAEAKLKALLEISRHLGRVVSVSDVLPKLLDSLFSIFLQADRGFVVLREPTTGRIIPKAVKHRRENSDEAIRISRTILNGVMAAKEAILSADAATDSRFDMAESIVDFQIHSMMCAPLVNNEGQVLGAIQIDTLDQRHRFTRDDLDVLASVACQAATVVDNAQLHEVALQEEALRRELNVAHQVQQGLLPAAPPEVKGYAFYDHYEPARQLGGDYFDYIPLGGGRLAIVLADVSGKGVAAALLMAKLSAETRFCLASESSLATAVGKLNRVFSESRWEDRFVTLVVGVLNPETHEIVLANAGHQQPLLRNKAGELKEIGEETGGLPIGVSSDWEYEEFTIRLAPGESLTFYTDGITDAMNPAGEFYGNERLFAQMAKPCDGVKQLGQNLIDSVRRHIGNRAQTDDICVTCFGRSDA
ncbi:MAG: SpoIIE family protein phosphatase [Rhodopirellula sp.]|nr:SpoIIE family protein phosphatase [Rhodopirellula sp.]